MTRDELIEKTADALHQVRHAPRCRAAAGAEDYRAARALADAGLLVGPEKNDDRYAVIHVQPRPGSDAWPVVERVPGGWQSGAHHYPDEDVVDVRPLPIPKHECEATLVEQMRDAEVAVARAQAEAVAAWRQVEQARIERNERQGRIDAVRAVLDRPWPDDEDHHDFVNQQVEDARAALQGDQPTESETRCMNGPAKQHTLRMVEVIKALRAASADGALPGELDDRASFVKLARAIVDHWPSEEADRG